MGVFIGRSIQPKKYRDYIQLGKMDYLYDSLKAMMQGKGNTRKLATIESNLQHMLHFLENHDEQRIASEDVAGNGASGKPVLIVSPLFSRSPTCSTLARTLGKTAAKPWALASQAAPQYLTMPAYRPISAG
ncbi:MAG: hypothetical protein ACI965_000500 [Paraglaciecola sp.]